ncbi:heme ABC transporter ATP-binding protein [Paenirhodobacter hankyongi]|uniref:Heme ABC transporter ATP-binding protein n=1 Tax=Paenirhodobacter hankyongi TaxID=2294033 RepID=A0A421BJT7_9RHOB|nr:heme ABC transporter ATP-binding protein [Sinirhodobacter hankyongi]RLL62124.1 heme ABC transporter ATP-binding protein [Sinirhodobacter hankyongi]
MLRIADLHVRLGRAEVLTGIDLDAAPGEVTVILGPNGSGKSTLLRAVSGEIPYAGSVRLAGHEVARTAPWRLAALRGVMEQASTVAFPFTVAEVVRLGLQSGIEAGEEIVAAALAEVGLSAFAHRPIQELSGGQQARAHLARVRAQVWHPSGHAGPRWLLLDEPVASLDIGHQVEVMAILRRFAQGGGGVVAVLHDLNLAASVADRIVLMAAGRIEAAGPPEAVLRDDLLSRVYGCPLRVGVAPVRGPWVLPPPIEALSA